MEESDEPRDIELCSVEAIYPEAEISRGDVNDPYRISLQVPVSPADGVVVNFPAPTADGEPPAQPIPAAAAAVAAGNHHGGVQGGLAINPDQNPNNGPDSHRLSYLPPLRLEITLPAAYPADEPPNVLVSTEPSWLPDDVVRTLQEDGPHLWESFGRDMVVYTYIDHIEQAAQGIFGLINDKGALEIDAQHKIAILDYDIKAKKAAFDRETFDCGVCLDPKKGAVCHRMVDCGHVFCVECLQDFYNNAIKEGDLATVRCLTPGCAKEREKKAAAERKGKKIKTFISPSELLQIPLETEVVARYVKLKYKSELESDKNTIYCPRSWCNGAARSKKHKKPEGFEFGEASDGEEEEEGNANADEDGKPKPYKPETELLCICDDCGFAFCSRCQQSWHGEFVRCYAPRTSEELSAEDKASLEYVKAHSTPCPTCAAPVQKTHGCNHMLCYRCQSHFCYLCSSWLAPDNPYQHFNQMPSGKRTGCYMRLWELEEGDGDDVGIGFAGGGGARAGGAPVPVEQIIPEIEEPDDNEAGAEELARRDREVRERRERDNARGGENAQPAQPAVAREGPLVLRIAGGQPAGAGHGGPRAAGAPPRAPEPPARGGQRQQHPPRGHVGPRGGRGGGGGGAPRGGAGQGRQAAAHGRPHLNGANIEPDVRGLDEAQQAWVRQFVQLALEDQEHVLLQFEDDDI